MNNIKTVLFIAILILLASCLNYAFAGEQEIKTGFDRDIRKEYKIFKDHHLKDIHSFKLFKYKREDKTVYVSFPLPIIIYCQGELDVFLSSKFYNQKNKRVEYKIDDRIYKIDDHEHIKARNSLGKFKFARFVYHKKCSVYSYSIFYYGCCFWKNGKIV